MLASIAPRSAGTSAWGRDLIGEPPAAVEWKRSGDAAFGEAESLVEPGGPVVGRVVIDVGLDTALGPGPGDEAFGQGRCRPGPPSLGDDEQAAQDSEADRLARRRRFGGVTDQEPDRPDFDLGHQDDAGRRGQEILEVGSPLSPRPGRVGVGIVTTSVLLEQTGLQVDQVIDVGRPCLINGHHGDERR